MSPSVSASVRVGAYAIEVGTPAGSFAQFEAVNEKENARALAAALAADPSPPSRPVAAAEAFNERTAAVTKRVEQADGLFRAAAEGRLHELDSVSGEIDVLLAVLKRLDGAGRFEEELRLLRALHGLLAVSLRWLDLIRALRRGLAASEAAGDRAAEAWVRHELGALHLAAGDAKTAAGDFAEALRLKEQLNDVTGRCTTRHNLDCAERAGARAAAPTGRPPRFRRQTALMAVLPLAALVFGVAAGRFQPAGENDDDGTGPAETQHIPTVSVPRPPEALDDRVEAREDEARSIPVADLLRNDRDPNGDDLVVTAVEPLDRTHGDAELLEGEVVYTPERNYNGPARFRYRISDGEDGAATGTVRIAVEAVNDDPQARRDTLPLLEGVPSSVNVLANDRDVDRDGLVVIEKTDGLRGSVFCSSEGECTYTPRSGEVGADTFAYTVSDGRGGETTGRVAVTIEPLPEISIADAAVVTEGAEAIFTVTLSAPSDSIVEVTWETDVHADGDNPAGEGDFSGAGGTVTFAPNETEQRISVKTLADGTGEGHETFLVRLFDVVNAELGKDVGIGTIRDPVVVIG